MVIKKRNINSIWRDTNISSERPKWCHWKWFGDQIFKEYKWLWRTYNISLCKCMTTRDIQDHIKKLFNCNISDYIISDIIDKVLQESRVLMIKNKIRWSISNNIYWFYTFYCKNKWLCCRKKCICYFSCK